MRGECIASRNLKMFGFKLQFFIVVVFVVVIVIFLFCNFVNLWVNTVDPSAATRQTSGWPPLHFLFWRWWWWWQWCLWWRWWWWWLPGCPSIHFLCFKFSSQNKSCFPFHPQIYVWQHLFWWIIFAYVGLFDKCLSKFTWQLETTSPSERSLESWNSEKLWNMFLVEQQQTLLRLPPWHWGHDLLARPKSSKVTTLFPPDCHQLPVLPLWEGGEWLGTAENSSNLVIWLLTSLSPFLSFSEARERESFECQSSKKASTVLAALTLTPHSKLFALVEPFNLSFPQSLETFEKWLNTFKLALRHTW